MKAKSNNVNSFPYFFTILEEFPSHVVLCFSPALNVVKREFIKIKNTGFVFHGILHKKLVDLIVFFKKN